MKHEEYKMFRLVKNMGGIKKKKYKVEIINKEHIRLTRFIFHALMIKDIYT